MADLDNQKLDEILNRLDILDNRIGNTVKRDELKNIPSSLEILGIVFAIVSTVSAFVLFSVNYMLNNNERYVTGEVVAELTEGEDSPLTKLSGTLDQVRSSQNTLTDNLLTLTSTVNSQQQVVLRLEDSIGELQQAINTISVSDRDGGSANDNDDGSNDDDNGPVPGRQDETVQSYLSNQEIYSVFLDTVEPIEPGSTVFPISDTNLAEYGLLDNTLLDEILQQQVISNGSEAQLDLFDAIRRGLLGNIPPTSFDFQTNDSSVRFINVTTLDGRVSINDVPLADEPVFLSDGLVIPLIFPFNTAQ